MSPLFSKHSGFKAALRAAFPELTFRFKGNLTISIPSLLTLTYPTLPTIGKSYWTDPDTLRSFFDKFAKEQSFDPRVPDNWYGVHVDTIAQLKVLSPSRPRLYFIPYFHELIYFSPIIKHGPVIKQYNSGAKNALKKAYPDLPWRENWKIIESPWNDIQKVRQFFDAYAKTTGFDPLIPDNWYQMSTKGLKTVKVVSYS